MPQNKPRSVFRFSLRFLLLAMIVVCITLGWRAGRAYEHRKAVEWVQSRGGTLEYAYQKRDATGYPLPSQPPGPTWLRKIVGIDYLDDVTSVSLSGAKVADLTPLTGLPKLRSLWLCENPFSDIAPIASLKKLEWLDISQSKVADLKPLTKLPKLRFLYIHATPNVTDFTPLAKLTSLEQLYASNTPITDVTPLAQLKALNHVDLLDTDVSDLSPLQNLQSLQSIRFRSGQVSDLSALKELGGVQLIIWRGGEIRVPISLEDQVIWQ